MKNKITNINSNQFKKNMKKEMIITDKQMAHSALYIYICVAKADYFISDSELATILKKIQSSSRYSHINYERILADTLKQHAGHTPEQISSYLEQYCINICKTEADKQALLSDLEDILEADGVVSGLEMMMYRQIKNLLQ